MRIMHLSDLHLGKTLCNTSLIDDQKYILDQVIEIAKTENIDVVLICGDIYDKQIPTIEATTLFDSFLNSLINELNKKVLIISGNHDSKERLSFGSEIFKSNGLYINSKFNGKIEKVELNDKYGNINFYLMPFVKPIDVKKYFDNISTYDNALEKVIKSAVCSKDFNKEQRNILLLHQFVTNTNSNIIRSESESINVGTLDNISSSYFDDFDYVALGHIHKMQEVSKNIIYSGTLLKYSFSESKDEKQIPIIDFFEKGNFKINYHKVIPKRDLIEIKGEYEQLLNNEDIDCDSYIKAIITDDKSIYNIFDKLKNKFPNLLKVEFINSKYDFENKLFNNSYEDIKMLSEFELFSNFYKIQNGEDLDNVSIEILNQIIKEVKDETT